MTAKKFDTGKPDMTLVPMALKEAVAKVMGFGCAKYGRDNWKAGEGLDWHRPMAAAMRHLDKHNEGMLIDEESGMPHIWHAATNIAFLCHYMKLGMGGMVRKTESILGDENESEEQS